MKTRLAFRAPLPTLLSNRNGQPPSLGAQHRYCVRGERPLGQVDAGKLSGGPSAIQGGFWGALFAVQTPGAPLLSLAYTTTNTVAVFWPSPAAGWTLQVNTNDVASVNWTNVTSGILDDNTTKTFIVNPPTGNRFYRLAKP